MINTLPAIGPANGPSNQLPRRGIRLQRYLVYTLATKVSVPTALEITMHGRPAAGVVSGLSPISHRISNSLGYVVIAICVLTIAYARSLPVASRIRLPWIAYAATGILSEIVNGFAPTQTALVTIAVLFSMRTVPRPDYAITVRIALLPLRILLVWSLLVAALLPSHAKFGDLHGHWLSRDTRLAGVFDQPNAIGLVAGFAFVLSFALLLQNGVNSLRIFDLTLAAVTLVLSLSYTSWVAVGVATLALAGSRSHTASRVKRLGFLGIAVGVGCWYLLGHLDSSDSLTTLDGRRAIWRFVWSNYGGSPLVGHGASIWSRLIELGDVPTWAVHAHDQYLDTLYTAGILGVVALFIALIATAAHACNAWTKRQPAALAILVLQLVRSYSEVPFQLLFGGLNLLLLVILLNLCTPMHRTPDE